MALPTGGIKLSQVNTELGYASNASITLGNATVRTIPHISSGAISMDDLRGKSKITAGVSYISNTGTSTWVIPNYNTLIIEMWGGGGAGGVAKGDTRQPNGSATTIYSLGLSAGAGEGGWNRDNSSATANGGTASGGDVNTNGNPNSTTTGGSAPNGGAGGYLTSTPFTYAPGTDGEAPGGGGGASRLNGSGTGGGSGAYVKKTYTYSSYSSPLGIGTGVSVTVGAGGVDNADAGSGGNGQIKITVS